VNCFIIFVHGPINLQGIFYVNLKAIYGTGWTVHQKGPLILGASHLKDL